MPKEMMIHDLDERAYSFLRMGALINRLKTAEFLEVLMEYYDIYLQQDKEFKNLVVRKIEAKQKEIMIRRKEERRQLEQATKIVCKNCEHEKRYHKRSGCQRTVWCECKKFEGPDEY
jgi:RNA polymerase-interacting CarD/CdnL/TRCF family regulator